MPTSVGRVWELAFNRYKQNNTKQNKNNLALLILIVFKFKTTMYIAIRFQNWMLNSVMLLVHCSN